MRISLQLPYFKFDGGTPAIAPKVKAIASAAEDADFYSMWVMDHFFQLGAWLGPAEDPMLEAYSTLSFLAGVTNRLKLGTLVTGVIYRYPAQLVNAVTTLDVLSEGRAYLGIGAAWYEEEAKSLGIPYPDTKTRFEMLEETLRYTHQMWNEDDNGAFDGKHIQATATINHPQPMSQPHPPIMIGGMGEKKTLKYVAQYGDACNLFASVGSEVLQHKLDVLKGHCDDVGRDYDDIEKTAIATTEIGIGNQTAADIIEQCQSLAALGISHVIYNHQGYDAILDTIDVMGKDVVPAVVDL